MANINRVAISGNLTRDPDMRSTAGGTTVMGFSVAVNDRRRNAQTGEYEDVPNFIDCSMFGARAEGLAPYLKKGMKVAVEGKLRYSAWERDGQRRSKLEVIVDEIEFMAQRTGGQQGQQGYAPQQQYAGAQQYQPAAQPPAQPQPVQQGQMNYYAPPGSASPTAQPQGVFDEEIPF